MMEDLNLGGMEIKYLVAQQHDFRNYMKVASPSLSSACRSLALA